MGYSTEGDLLLGNIPLPTYAGPAKYIADAQKEIDSVVGFIYETPLDLSDTSSMVKPARLLIERISNWLATGRLILAVAAGSEKVELHAYGKSLVDQASAILEQIGCGDIALDGAATIEGSEKPFAGPQIYNEDVESNVEAFYDRIANPNYPSSSFSGAERGIVR